jgi:hypothetical protein
MVIPTYEILRSDASSLALAEQDILLQVAHSGHTPVRVLFFADIKSNDEYEQSRARIAEQCGKIFGACAPMVVLVAQPPLEGGLLAEVTYVNSPCNITYHTDYILLDDGWLFSAGLCSNLGKSIEEQSDDIFGCLGEMLSGEGFAINDIVRQWNYIENITHISAQGQHYQQFNDSRSRFYSSADWPNGYPAATGIGASCGGVVVVVDAIKHSGEFSRVIDNPLQQSAHKYSQQVLIDGSNSQHKTTPKFERARWVGAVSDVAKSMIYVSGTAAIRGEESVHEDAVGQGVMTLENIAHLITPSNQQCHGVPTVGEYDYEVLRIYVKPNIKWQPIKDWLQESCKCKNIIPVEADICRDELLLEIEAVAKIALHN